MEHSSSRIISNKSNCSITRSGYHIPSSIKLTKKPQKKVNIKAINEYRLMCQKIYSTPSQAFISALKTDSLQLYLDSYHVKEANCINKIIGKYYDFTEITLLSHNPEKGDLNKQRKRNSNSLTPAQLTPKEREQEKKIIKDQQKAFEQKIYTIVQGVSKNLCLSETITKFSLWGLNLTMELTSFLSEGLIANKTLVYFALLNCQISLDSYEILLRGFLTHETIVHIDLSNNGFDDKYANMISRIIARQTHRRDQIIWSYNLRNEMPPNNDYTKGLISLYLADNQFSDYAAELISNTLYHDQYIRSVDLSGNLFSKTACKKFIRILRNNSSILNLDLKENLGYDPEIHARMVMKMSKNIQYLNQQVLDNIYSVDEYTEMKTFINLSFFNVDIPDEVIDMYNCRLSNSINSQSMNSVNQSTNNKNSLKVENEGSSQIHNKNEKEGEEECKQEIDNGIHDNNNVAYLKLKNKKLTAENIILKKELVEMKVKSIEGDIIQKKDSKKTYPQIESNYNRIVELLSELTDLMNNVESEINKEGETIEQKRKVIDKNNKERDDYNEKEAKEEKQDNKKSDKEIKENKLKSNNYSSSTKIAEDGNNENKKALLLIKEKEIVSSVMEKPKIPFLPLQNDKASEERKEELDRYCDIEYDEHLEMVDADESRRRMFKNYDANQYMMFDDERNDYNDDDYDDVNTAYIQQKMNKSF